MRSSRILTVLRLTVTTATAALFGGFALAAPAAAHVATTPAVAAQYGMSAGRLGSTVAAVLGLVGVVVGGLALARPGSRVGADTGRLGATVALAAGLVGTALGGLVVATSDSGIGTGNGRAGGYVAVVVGLIAVVLGGLTLARARRAG